MSAGVRPGMRPLRLSPLWPAPRPCCCSMAATRCCTIASTFAISAAAIWSEEGVAAACAFAGASSALWPVSASVLMSIALTSIGTDAAAEDTLAPRPWWR